MNSVQIQTLKCMLCGSAFVFLLKQSHVHPSRQSNLEYHNAKANIQTIFFFFFLHPAVSCLARVQSVSWVAFVVLIAVAQYLLSMFNITQTEHSGWQRTLQNTFPLHNEFCMTCTMPMLA